MTMAKILIVEDDNTINSLLYDLLSPDYQVDQAYSGTEGIRLLSQDAYDLVLLDLMLPGLSGEVFIKEVRSNSLVPIVVITAKSEMSVLDNVLQLGANDYIAKPFHTVEVRARVANQLNQSKNAKVTGRLIQLDEIVIDLDSYQAKINNQELNLKTKEFDLLKCFIQYPNKVFTKANLYQSVWGEDYYGDDNTISVHMSRLRREIAKHTDREIIQTIWGVGFKYKYQ